MKCHKYTNKLHDQAHCINELRTFNNTLLLALMNEHTVKTIFKIFE